MNNFVRHLLSREGLKSVEVQFSEEKFSRARSNAQLEAWIEQKWEEKMKANTKLWNGSKFRLDSVSNECILNVGLTCYKDLHATNYNKPFEISDEFLANPFGTCGVLLTSDDKVIITRRANWVGENRGMLAI